MIRLALVLALLLAAPATAQVPCGVVDPCPTATPSPEPTASPSPSPTPVPDVPVEVDVRVPREAVVGGGNVEVSGTVTGPDLDRVGRQGSPEVELVVTSTRLGRVLLRTDVDVQVDDGKGSFHISLFPSVEVRVEARAKAGSGITGGADAARMRVFSDIDLGGYFLRENFLATFVSAAPNYVFLEDGRRFNLGGHPRRAYFYVGTGRVLRRVATSRMRGRGGERRARFRISRSRLPAGRFRYAACFRGPGASGMTPNFTNCGAPRFRIR